MNSRGMDILANLSRTHYIVLVGSILQKSHINVSKLRCHAAIWKFYQFVLIFLLSVNTCSAHWQKPGCHVVGRVRQISIDGCVKFPLEYNACRGYCESYAFPSPFGTIMANAKHIITSRAECCSIEQTHDINVTVSCLEGTRNLTFKGATTCSCSLCRK